MGNNYDIGNIVDELVHCIIKETLKSLVQCIQCYSSKGNQQIIHLKILVYNSISMEDILRYSFQLLTLIQLINCVEIPTHAVT